MSRSISSHVTSPRVLILAASLVLAGCDTANKTETQYDDSRNPYYKQAQQALDNNDSAGAAADYETALGANPKLAEAHYQLGHLYAEKLNDPVGSIYHFQQYLKLDPTSDKADEVKALIDKQSQAFAASLPNSPTQSADDYAKLQADNASLKKQVDDATATIAQLQAQIAHPAKHHHDVAATAPVPPVPADASASQANPPVPPVAPAVADNNGPAAASVAVPETASAPTNAAPPRALPVDPNAPDASAAASGTPAPGAGPSRTYTVVKGDSIWKIAHKMYPGDTKNGEDKIRDANKDLLNGKFLKPGQVLVIP